MSVARVCVTNSGDSRRGFRLLLSIAPNRVIVSHYLVFEVALDSTFGACRCTPEETSDMNGETPEIDGQVPESNRLTFWV